MPDSITFRTDSGRGSLYSRIQFFVGTIKIILNGMKIRSRLRKYFESTEFSTISLNIRHHCIQHQHRFYLTYFIADLLIEYLD